MAAPEPIDLHHLGRERIIASYLLDTDDGPALFDCGPDDDCRRAQGRPRRRGLEADRRPPPAAQPHPPRPRGRRGRARARAPGAAGARLADRRAAPRRPGPAGEERAPAVRRHASTRSGASSRRCRRRTSTRSTGRVLGLDSFPTPGHASHHVCYLDPDGTLYAGDACGVRVLPGRFVMPPTPPPEVDVEAWQRIARRDRAARARAARAHPLRRRRGRRAPRHRAAADPARLGGVGRGRRDGGGVRRVRACASSPTRARTHRRTTSRCRSGSRTAGSSAGRRSAPPPTCLATRSA